MLKDMIRNVAIRFFIITNSNILKLVIIITGLLVKSNGILLAEFIKSATPHPINKIQSDNSTYIKRLG
jgi:hypothetical protein